MSIANYEEFNQKKRDLIDIMMLLAEQIDHICDVGLDLDAEVLVDLKCKLDDDRFKVLVLGGFKNGKSTFINALMGAKVLPAYPTPCTAVINEVTYGEEKYAEIHFKNPLPEKISPDIQRKAAQHIQKHKMDKDGIPSYQISADELADYVMIPHTDKGQKEFIQETPYSKVTLRYPIEMCRNGIDLIDSPGLNENETRTKVTQEYLRLADAILFVFRCPHIAGQNEMRYVQNELHPQGYRDIFFICNAIDQALAKELPRFQKLCIQKLAPMTSFGEKGVFCLNALDALKAKEKHDGEALALTGLPEFENALSHFLNNSRGRTKLVSIIEPCVAFIDAACLPQTESYIQSLGQSLREFEQRVAKAEPALTLAKAKEELVAKKIEDGMKKLRSKIESCTKEQYETVAKGIPAFVEKLDLENHMSLNIFKHKAQQELLIEEVSQKLEAYLQEAMDKWSRERLTKLLNQELDKLEADIGHDIDVFYNELNFFRHQVSDVKRPNNISGASRVGEEIDRTLAGGPVYGLMGTTMDLGETTKRVSIISAITSATSIAAGALICLMIRRRAAAATASIFAVGALQVLNSGKTLTETFITEFAEEFLKSVLENKDTNSKEYAEKLTESIQEKFDLYSQALKREVEIEEGKIESLRQDKQKNEKLCKKKIQALQNAQKDLKGIRQQLLQMKSDIE